MTSSTLYYHFYKSNYMYSLKFVELKNKKDRYIAVF